MLVILCNTVPKKNIDKLLNMPSAWGSHHNINHQIHLDLIFGLVLLRGPIFLDGLKRETNHELISDNQKLCIKPVVKLNVL